MSQVLLRALDLLDAIAERPGTLHELSTRFDTHKTTVMRLLRTLQERHYVVRHPDGTFHLGHRLFALAQTALEDRPLRQLAHEHLVELSRDVGQTVHLAALDGDSVVYLDKIEPRTPVRLQSRIGLEASPRSAAVAKILIGALPQERQEQIAAELDLTPLTANTLRTRQGVRAAWAEAARVHWAPDREENEELVHCVAVPVMGPDRAVHGALSVTAPTVLATFDQLLGLLPRMHRTAQAISRDLGHPGPVPGPILPAD